MSRVNHLAVQLDVHLVKVPFPLPKAPHPFDPLSPEIRRKYRPEAVPPQTHRLMAEIDASLEQQILHIPQRQWKTNVHHRHEADYLG